MALNLGTIVADFTTTLATALTVGGTTATLTSATDDDGVALPSGTYYFTIDGSNSSKEHIVCTLSGTSLTAIQSVSRQGALTTGVVRAHRIGSSVVLTDHAVLKSFQNVLTTGYNTPTTPSSDYQLATKKYVDDTAAGGTVAVDKVSVVGTAGETITAGQLIYLKVSDSKWWKCDADTVTTLDNVVLGIAQGAGSTDGLITGGVLVKGVDANQTGLTASSIYYASNTAGGISLTSGTNTRVIGVATSTTQLLFDPEFNKTYKNYAVDSVGTDAYAITLQSAFGAYYAGMEVSFKAGTANTGAATLNVNSLGAKTIKKDVSTDLATGDILANQIVTVKYDGTNFQMTSLVAGAKDATKFTGILPVVNGGTGLATAAVPFFQQFMAISSSDLGTYYGLTGSNSDGSVIVVYNTNAKLTRYARDTNTGIYMYTHEINPALSINGNDSSMIIIGSYIYIFSASTNIVCTRFLLADLTGETTMSVPTTAATRASAWTNGTDAYVVSNTTSTTSRKWTISGTTMSEASTATCTSTVSNNGQAQSSIWDGTNPYIVRKTGTTEITVYKLSDIIGTSVSSTTSSWTDSMGDSPVGCYAASIDSTKMYFGYSYDIYNSSALDHQELTLIPITKP